MDPKDPTEGIVVPMGRKCKAKARSTGGRCGRLAMAGLDVCDIHGGKSPGARATAAHNQLVARISGELAEMDIEPVVDPLHEFALATGETLAWRDLCRAHVNRLNVWTVSNELTGVDEVRALVQVYERAMDRASRDLERMLRLGLDAQALRQAKERPTREQAEAFSRILDHLLADLSLTDDQRAQVPAALAAAISKEGLLGVDR